LILQQQKKEEEEVNAKNKEISKFESNFKIKLRKSFLD
jgi:hypothetical protein